MTRTTTGQLFESPPATGAKRIRCGIGGWVYAPWRGRFYPAGLTQKRELEYASRALATIEINSTYYRAQRPAIYEHWAAQTPAHFIFSLKAPRLIVERRQLAETGEAARRFLDDLQALGDRLGPIVWQLAPSRRFDRDDLAGFLDSLPRTLNGSALRHVLEVRHASFQCAEYVNLARTHGVPTVFTDAPQFPSMADLTGDFVYARLMQSRSGVSAGYTKAALDAWSEHARAWARGGDPNELPHVEEPAAGWQPREVFIYIISAAKETNPDAAQALQRRVDAADRD